MADKRFLIEKGKKFGITLNLDKPVTIQDKLNWIKLNPDNLDLMTKCSDKIKLAEYCKERLGINLCNEIYQIGEKFSDIDRSKLPDKFVIKCNHGSSYNIIVKDSKKVDWKYASEKISKWLATDYSKLTGEVCYEKIPRRVFVEKMFEDEDPIDYKFWCFNGEPKFFTCNHPGSAHINHYDLDFNLLPISRKEHPADPKLTFKKPEHLQDMIEYARKLSEPFKFVRVDFYEIKGNVVLGEMTFFPGAAFPNYEGDFGTRIGSLLNIEGAKNQLSVNDVLVTKTFVESTKRCVYTAMFGNYDSLPEVTFITPGFDYICFTDQDIISKTWKIVNFNDFPMNNLDNARKNRYIKLNPHKILSEYDLSIYVDSNVQLKGNLTDFIVKNQLSKNHPLIAGKHPTRNCIFAESLAVIKIKKDTVENVKPQMERYEKEGMPKNYGLTQNCILIRYHNDPWVVKIMEMWWQEVLNGSKRDQLSLFYVIWKCGNKNIKILPSTIFRGEYFKWNAVHKKTSTTANTPKTNSTGIKSRGVTRRKISPPSKSRLTSSQIGYRWQMGY